MKRILDNDTNTYVYADYELCKKAMSKRLVANILISSALAFFAIVFLVIFIIGGYSCFYNPAAEKLLLVVFSGFAAGAFCWALIARGINDIFDAIKDLRAKRVLKFDTKVKQAKEDDKFCTLVFDEQPIQDEAHHVSEKEFAKVVVGTPLTVYFGYHSKQFLKYVEQNTKK